MNKPVNVKVRKLPLMPIVVLAALGLLFDGIAGGYLSYLDTFELEIQFSGISLIIFAMPLIMFLIALIYTPCWFAMIRKQARKAGYKDLPSTWLILIPIYGYLRLAYKHGQLMEQLVDKRYSWAIPFLLGLFVNSFAMILFNQYQYNLLADKRKKSAKK